jgi:hypothetical protein
VPTVPAPVVALVAFLVDGGQRPMIAATSVALTPWKRRYISHSPVREARPDP